jgi:ribonuclease R
MKLTQEKILSLIKKKVARPMKVAELSRLLGIPETQKREFRNHIKEMAGEGTLIKIRGGRYGLPDEMHLITGKLHGHPNGFGFVISDKPDGEDDVYVNARHMNEAMHKDHVVVRIESEREPGKPAGRIIRILQRNTTHLVGTYETFGKDGWVIPTEAKYFHDVFVPGKHKKGAKNGQIVHVEIETFPTRHQPPIGKVAEVLGSSNDPNVEIQSIFRKHGVRQGFPPEVLDAARDAEAKDGFQEKRKDFTQLLTFTIDGERAKDFDDAVSLERFEEGYRLGVHIADVSHFVQENSLLDQEALERGTSIYYADGVIPMLPVSLSNEACSLKPDEPRLTLSAIMDFDREANFIAGSLHPSIIKSQRRFTYNEVHDLLEKKKEDDPFMQTLTDMHHVSQLLRKKRFQSGSVDFHVPEPEIHMDSDGHVKQIGISEHNLAHELIEEFMLAANQFVALNLHERGIPCIHRIHEAPNPERLTHFNEFIASFGLKVPSPARSTDFQALLKKIQGRPEERVVNTLLLRTMKKARYSEADPGHFCLGFPHYAHFTSPIRRYPDLILHRIIKKYLKRKCPPKEKKGLLSHIAEVSEQSTQMEIQAMAIEREVIDLRRAQFMMDKIGQTFHGIIVGVTGFGFFVELEEVFVEGLVKISSIMDDYYLFIEPEHRLIGQKRHRCFQIGDPVKVRVSGVDMGRKQIDLVVL